MTVYHLFIAVCLVAFLAIAALAAWETIAHAWVGYQDGARLATKPGEHFADMADLPETTAFDAPVDLPRARLVSSRCR